MSLCHSVVKLMRLIATAAVFAYFSSFAAAQSVPASDKLGVPGPIVFEGIEYRLAWTSQPSAGYVKQEYIPVGERLDSYASMIILERAGGTDVETAVAGQLEMLAKRKESDPLLRVDLQEPSENGQVLLDFMLSDSSTSTLIVEWNAYRYFPVSMSDGTRGVALFAISRRGYGKAARDFFTDLTNTRMDTIQALRVYDLRALSGTQAAQGGKQVDPSASNPSPGAFATVLKPGMSYAEFRAAALNAGWTPHVEPECRANVYGRNGGPDDGTNICTQLPELEACSGDGHCSMVFEDGGSGKRMGVTTYGDYLKWNVPGEESELAVLDWNYK
ncbi:hypothetical protein [Neorhizobium petrolearium]|uniref:hypothetical protein n=1 Tax=Neorhizobium petrolearium TaxID=515361 RepID=UPI003F7EC308